jgi:protein phosphatase
VEASRVVRIPDPSLVVLVGAAGAGKTTFAARWFGPGEVLSSDAFREVVSGDAADQRATRRAFGMLHRALMRRLASGRLTVVDATNVQTHARRALLRRAALAGVPAVALVFDLPPALVLARNAIRPERIVPTGIVVEQLSALAHALRRGTMATEGYTSVVVLRGPREVDALVLERVPASTSPRSG